MVLIICVSIGDFYRYKSLGETFNLSGARLTTFHVDENEVVEFRPTGMTTIAALCCKELVLKRVASLVGGLDLSIFA